MHNHGKLTINRIEYHRNGISGIGFHVVTFSEKDGKETRNMAAFVFPERGAIACIEVGLLARGIVGMFDSPGNAWRGDVYEPEIRAAIAKHQEAA